MDSEVTEKLLNQVSTGEWQRELTPPCTLWNCKPDGESESKNNRQTISNDCLWCYFFKRWEIIAHLLANHFSILKKQHTVHAFILQTEASAQPLNELHLNLPLCSVIINGDVQFSLDSSKKFWNKLKCCYDDFVGKKKKVKYTVGGLDCLCRAANAKNVTINIDVHWFHNIKNHEKCYWSSLVFVSVCAWTHMNRELVLCGWVYYWGNASSFISMRGLSWLSMRRRGPIMLFLCLNDLDLLGEFGFLSDFLFLAFFSAP